MHLLFQSDNGIFPQTFSPPLSPRNVNISFSSSIVFIYLSNLDPKTDGGSLQFFFKIPPIPSLPHSLIFSLYHTQTPISHHHGLRLLYHFQKSENSNPANYRPISLLLLSAKSWKIIKESQCDSLLIAGRIFVHQRAFISQHSTTANLLEAAYDWSILLNNRRPVDVKYTEFQKACDSLFIAN